MNIYLNIFILIFSVTFNCQIYAGDCSQINKLIVESNIFVDINKLKDIDYVKQLLHKAAKIDQNIRSESYRQCKNLASAVVMIDKNNTASLKKVLSSYSWLKISKFGTIATSDAWIIVQHSPDLYLQHKVLFIMGNLIDSNEVNKQQFALLYDRVSLSYSALGLKQKYGTQYTIDGNKLIMQPCEGTIAQLDARRKDFGFEPVDEYEAILKSVFLKNLNEASS